MNKFKHLAEFSITLVCVSGLGGCQSHEDSFHMSSTEETSIGDDNTQYDRLGAVEGAAAGNPSCLPEGALAVSNGTNYLEEVSIDELVRWSDRDLFEAALDHQLGSCYIFDSRHVHQNYCDYYVKSAVVGTYGYTGYPKNPQTGDSTGCVVGPKLPKGVTTCWGGYQSSTMCTSDHVKNAANQLRRALLDGACGAAKVTPTPAPTPKPTVKPTPRPIVEDPYASPTPEPSPLPGEDSEDEEIPDPTPAPTPPGSGVCPVPVDPDYPDLPVFPA